LLIASYRQITGRELVPVFDAPVETARRLFEAPFALVSHDAAPDPLFNYANLAALVLFETSWDRFVGMPSRRSAEAPEREERERFLEAVKKRGFMDDYRGLRVSATGRRFLVEGATVWNVRDARGAYLGQAARLDRWRFL
jgi:hypothetical protein